jgi:hypothetical protein
MIGTGAGIGTSAILVGRTRLGRRMGLVAVMMYGVVRWRTGTRRAVR